MKRYSLLAATVLLFATSCGVKVSTDDDKTKVEDKTEVTATAAGKTAVVKDPSCGMEKDSTWTEYAVKGSDTTWFCSPHCKETFAKKQAAKPEETKKG